MASVLEDFPRTLTAMAVVVLLVSHNVRSTPPHELPPADWREAILHVAPPHPYGVRFANVAAPSWWAPGTLTLEAVDGPCAAASPVRHSRAVSPLDCVDVAHPREHALCNITYSRLAPPPQGPTLRWCLVLRHERGVIAREIAAEWQRDVVGRGSYTCHLASGGSFSGYCHKLGPSTLGSGRIESGLMVHASEWQTVSYGTPTVITLRCGRMFTHVRFRLGRNESESPPCGESFELQLAEGAPVLSNRLDAQVEPLTMPLDGDGSTRVGIRAGKSLHWRHFALGDVECLRVAALPPPPEPREEGRSRPSETQAKRDDLRI